MSTITGEIVQLVHLDSGDSNAYLGTWGPTSPTWEEVGVEERGRLGVNQADQGEFWMSYTDFMRTFTHLEVEKHLKKKLFPIIFFFMNLINLDSMFRWFTLTAKQREMSQLWREKIVGISGYILVLGREGSQQGDAGIIIIYMIKQDIRIYVPYNRPNGWTEWANNF